MLVVVGGHSRNIGKTSVVAGIIRKLHHWKWTAVKTPLLLVRSPRQEQPELGDR